MKLIDKDKVAAEIERRIAAITDMCDKSKHPQFTLYGKINALENLLPFIDTLEVKDVETWHLQEKEDIYDAVKDWSLHTFACVMKDGSIQRFTGNLDEDCGGHINVHIYGVNDDYDNVDDIVKWIEIT